MDGSLTSPGFSMAGAGPQRDPVCHGAGSSVALAPAAPQSGRQRRSIGDATQGLGAWRWATSFHVMVGMMLVAHGG